MVQVLILLLSIIVILLVRNSGTASIEIPKNATHILDSTSLSSSMNITEDQQSIGVKILEFNQTSISNNENGGIVSETSEHDHSLNVSDLIMPSLPENTTCTRRDYEGNIAAVFIDKVGPISTAFILFNTTYSSFQMGSIFNTTELTGLKMVNETTIDCSEYLPFKAVQLDLNAKYSLTG